MPKTFYCLLAVLGLLATAKADSSSTEPAAPVPSADALLDEVLLRLPTEPLQIAGEFRADPREGKSERRGLVQVFLEYGASPPRARYTFMNLFGGDLEQMTIVRPSGESPRWYYARGTPLVEAPAPDPSAPIQETDLSWADLSLSFLWWRPAVWVGEETVLDRPCLILEVRPGPSEPSLYAKVRLWIDRQHRFLLRAEGFDQDGNPRRRVGVKSIMKIDGEWMIKDLDVTTLPERWRTSLRMEVVDRPQGAASPR